VSDNFFRFISRLVRGPPKEAVNFFLLGLLKEAVNPLLLGLPKEAVNSFLLGLLKEAVNLLFHGPSEEAVNSCWLALSQAGRFALRGIPLLLLALCSDDSPLGNNVPISLIEKMSFLLVSDSEDSMLGPLSFISF